MTAESTTRSSGRRRRLEVALRGHELLDCALYNKGTGFSLEERSTFGLEGLIPHGTSSLALQSRRAYESIARKQDPLERYIGLAALQDRNEHLFYRVLLDHLEEFLPIVYTPTVGEASKQYSRIFRRGRGVWITPEHRGRVREVLANGRPGGVRLIVVTDNEAILGIGDQGAGGMVIPIGKLAIYTAAAGIHPMETLAVSLDVGTDNQVLLDDEFYLGWRQPRLRGAAYLELVEEFVSAVSELYPGVLVQWEDFRKDNAFDLLERYRDRILSFNDDIQGTGAVALAGLITASRIAGVELKEHRVLIVGAGAAGVGIARQLRAALEAAGVQGDELVRAVALTDSRGLLVDDRPGLEDYKRSVAWPRQLATALGIEAERDLEGLVDKIRPTVLIGTSGQAGTFTRPIVATMSTTTERPVIFPFSNPTDHSEARPEDLLRWTEGRALVATGSPFSPVEVAGQTIHIGQGNNAFVFPAVGLAALVPGCHRISDDALSAAAAALSEQVSADEMRRGQLFPDVPRLRAVTEAVAAAVARRSLEECNESGVEASGISRAIADSMWSPEYAKLVPV